MLNEMSEYLRLATDEAVKAVEQAKKEAYLAGQKLALSHLDCKSCATKEHGEGYAEGVRYGQEQARKEIVDEVEHIDNLCNNGKVGDLKFRTEILETIEALKKSGKE